MNAPELQDRPLAGKHLLLGVSGGIAAYKTPDLVRHLVRAGAEVQVLATRNALQFVAPLALATVSGREVITEIFPDSVEGSWTRHVELGLWADLYIVAPCTAQTAARLAHGFADDVLTVTALAARCNTLIFPAMDHDMFHHPATRANLDILRHLNYEVVPPATGELASGLVGDGRLLQPEEIVETIVARVRKKGTMAGRHVLVTAGPTREAIDPVRFLTNHSTGTMGFALAAEAASRGADVTLVAGPVSLSTPPGVRRVDVVNAAEMRDAVIRAADNDLVIMAAAVADFTPASVSDAKIKKTGDDLVLQLVRTTDILASLGSRKMPGQILVGFALETDDVLRNASYKLEKKNLDWIVLNNLRESGAGFGAGTNKVTLLSRDGGREDLPVMEKRAVAAAILDRVAGPVKQ